MIVRLGAVAGVLLLLAGCAGGVRGDRDPMNRPGYVSSGERAGAVRSQPDRARPDGLRGRSGATVFSIVNGADEVRIRLADLGGDAYYLSTPDDARIAPTVALGDGEIMAGVRDAGGAGPAVLDVVLDETVRWRIRLAGGAAVATVDLSGGPGGDVDLVAGTSRASVTLPPGSGTQRVTVGGGAGEITVRLLGDAPARVRAGAGAGSVTVDGTTHTGIAPGRQWAPSTWDSAADRYAVVATAGVAAITVSRS